MTTRSTTAAQAMLSAELDRIAGLERTIRASQAEQFRCIDAARQLAAEVEGVTDASSSVDREFALRSFVAEVASTLVVHEATAGRLIADAARLADEFTGTLDALADGSLTMTHVRSLLEVATTLPTERAAEFEALALERAARETPSAFRRRIRRLRERLHPEPPVARHQRAREDRRVCLDPAEDGMAWLGLYLEAERGVAIMARLDALADAGPAAGAETCDDTRDPRSRAQLTLDVAADLLLGQGAGDLESSLGVVTPRVYVTVPVLTLLGHADEPADLDGYGPIDAQTARRLCAHAPSFRRILTHPETGAYLSYGRTSYRVPADLAGYLRIRDGGCRFPGCSRRAAGCDIDHTKDWGVTGATRHDNLAHLCRKHHRLKHNTTWRMSQTPTGDIHWVSPAGRVHLARPDHTFHAAMPVVPSAHAAMPVVPSAHAALAEARRPDDRDADPPWAARRAPQTHPPQATSPQATPSHATPPHAT